MKAIRVSSYRSRFSAKFSRAPEARQVVDDPGVALGRPDPSELPHRRPELRELLHRPLPEVGITPDSGTIRLVDLGDKSCEVRPAAAVLVGLPQRPFHPGTSFLHYSPAASRGLRPWPHETNRDQVRQGEE